MIKNNIYVNLRCGMGNILFQLAAAMMFATKYNKQLIINERAIKTSVHENNKDKIVERLKNLFPNLIFSTDHLITIDNKQAATYPPDKLLTNLYEYNESRHLCFTYLETVIAPYFMQYDNIMLSGFFINYNYLKDNTVFSNINLQPENKELLNINFDNLYFIHIRLGDYVGHSLHYIDLTKYYNFCIKRIKNFNSQARFYICTNSHDESLTKYIDSFPKDDYIIQDAKDTVIDTLYIMSSCIGGICANSTLSFLGAYFQKNKNKNNIYMPYPIVNFLNLYNGENVNQSLYPEWCIIYNTLNDMIDNFFYVKKFRRPRMEYINKPEPEPEPKKSNNPFLNILHKYKKPFMIPIANLIKQPTPIETPNYNKPIMVPIADLKK